MTVTRFIRDGVLFLVVVVIFVMALIKIGLIHISLRPSRDRITKIFVPLDVRNPSGIPSLYASKNYIPIIYTFEYLGRRQTGPFGVHFDFSQNF